MKILFDHQAFNRRFGGVSRYHYELAKGLIKNNQEVGISTLFSENEYLLSDSTIDILNPIGHKKFKGRNILSNILTSINQQYSLYNIRKGNYEIFHPTYYSPYFLKSLHAPFVLTIHDFINEKFDLKRYNDLINKKILAKRADKIIAISQNTKSDIISYYSIPEDKITVIYHGYNLPDNLEYFQNTLGNYILFVGNRDDEYKNFKLFLIAVSRILKEEKSIRLVCTGDPFSKKEINLFKDLQISDRIIQVSANEKTMNTLYKNALIFVFPSLYEGFGMPILEAFVNDCPICLSSTGCFPEIAQNAALFFDPYEVDSIYDAMKKLIYDSELRQNLKKEGHLRLLDFSWAKTTNETMQLYEKLL